jgi:hypothetical protein
MRSVKSKHSNERKRLNRFDRRGYVIDFACSVSELDPFPPSFVAFPPPDHSVLDISVSHRHNVRVVELSEAFRFFNHPSLALKHNNGIRMALNFSESNLEKSGSELIEYKSKGFG